MQEKTKRQNSHNFLQGALILSMSVVAVKVIGAIFKIPLTNLLGELGMGYFNTAYQIYMPIYTIATAGFPVAISKMVAHHMALGKYRDVRRIYRISVPIFILSGLLGFVVMFFGAKPYAQAIHSGNAVYCVMLMAPTVFFCCMMAVFRGYYEGMGNMVPTAVSQVVEAVFKLFAGLLFAYLIMQRGIEEYAFQGTVFGVMAYSEEEALNITLPYAAAGAISGVTIGSFLGLCYLILYKKIKGDGIAEEKYFLSSPPESSKKLVHQLLVTALPVCMGALVINIGALIDVTFLQSRLAAIPAEQLRGIFGDTVPESISAGNLTAYLYGAFTMAQNVAMLVPTVAQSFGVSALPSVAAAWAVGKKENHRNIKKSVESVIRLSALVAFPCGFGLAVLPQQVLSLLFSSRPNGVMIAAPVLRVLAVTVILMTISVPVNSMLQAVGRVDMPVKLLSVGMLLKLVMNYTLVAVPEINLLGACYGSVVCYGLITVFGIYILCRTTGIRLSVGAVLGKPMLSAAACAAAAWGVYGFASRVLSPSVSTVAAIGAAVFVYLLFLLLTRTFAKEDILMLPKGEKICKLLEKRHWIR